MFWWIYFPNEVSRIIGTLDRSRLAEDIARSRPREWRLLAEFAAFIDPAVHEFFGLKRRLVVIEWPLPTNEHGIEFYLRNKNNPMMANATPTILCHDGGSRKKRTPAMAMIAAPPAKIAGTEESGPPF